MKRLATLLLAAGLVFGATHAAQAIEFKGSGIFQAYFGWSDYIGGGDMNEARLESNDRFRPAQRMRLKIEAIASENLRAVFHIENDILWGNEEQGGQIGGDKVTVEVKQAYLDWVIPSTDVKVRMGLQPIVLPGMVAGSAIMDEDATAIVVSKRFNENIASTFFWMRAYNNNSGNIFTPDSNGHDAADFFALTVPMTFNGFNITPWAMYGQTGKNMSVNNAAGKAANGRLHDFNDANIWFGGITAELIAFDPFRFAIDFNYGDADTEIESESASGFYVAALAEYKLDMMTPGLLLWYASGDDADANVKGAGTMPVLNASWKGTTLGFSDYFGSGNNSTELFGDSPVGTYGVALQAKNISFMDGLTHLARVAYYEGTNNENNLITDGSPSSGQGIKNYLTEDDSIIELNFNTKYQIYENLAFVLELAWLNIDLDKRNMYHDKHEDAYRINAGFGYSF